MYSKNDCRGDIVKTYSVFIEKGGTGKTATVLAMLSYLTHNETTLLPDEVRGKRVLAMDFDPQMTLTRLVGVAQCDKTIVEVLTDECNIKDAIVNVEGYGDVVPCKKMLAGLAPQFHGDALTILKEKLQELEGIYDYILIDCQPGVSGLPLAALVASDGVIVPVQASLSDIYSLPDSVPALETARRYNPGLKVEGVLLTMYEGRQNASKTYLEVAEKIAREQLHCKIFNTKIRRGVAIKEAQGMGKGLYTYAPNSNVAIDYAGFIRELLGGNNGR